MLHQRYSIVFAAVCLSYGTVLCAESPSGRQAQFSTKELIHRLGDGSFGNRETARNELLRRGFEIKGDLVASMNYPDLEVRFRIREILAHISKADFERRIAAFIADVAGKHEHNLPGWSRYQEVVGSDRSDRQLFAEMLRQESELLQNLKSVEAKPRGTALMFAARMQNPQLYRGNSATPQASMAALLFLGSHPKLTIDTTTNYKMYSFLSNGNTMKALNNGSHAEQLRKLAGLWFIRGASGQLSSQFMMLSMRYDLGETNLEIGRKMVQKKGLNLQGIPYAILTVGKYGSKDDIKLLKPPLQDTTVCYRYQGGRTRKLIEVQVRDVALATIMHLRGQDPQGFGFELIRKDSTTLFRINTLGFTDDAKRQAAVKKWQTWSAKQSM